VVILVPGGTCIFGQRQVPVTGDCDDTNKDINPDAAEIPDDGIDQDCNGADTITCIVDADQDGFGTTLGTTALAADGSCDAAQGESTTSDDCNDGDPGINPSAAELGCNGIDENCNGPADDTTVDADGDTVSCATDPDDADGTVCGLDADGDTCDDCAGGLGPDAGSDGPDGDGDGYCDAGDNCPLDANDQTDTDGDGVGDGCDICPTAFNPSQQLSSIGDRVWLDLDGNGIQDGPEPGVQGVDVTLLDALDATVNTTSTGPTGSYQFLTCPGDYRVLFTAPSGTTFTAQDQGGDDAVDSDADVATGRSHLFAVGDAGVDASVDAGLLCSAPPQALVLTKVTLSNDANEYPTLHFQDPNDPALVSGYNVYRSADASLPLGSWSLVGAEITDEDGGTPDIQWTDSSGAAPPAGIWYYQVVAVNGACGLESPQ
jgi:hypothetical protein